MAKALDLIPDNLLQTYAAEVRKLFAEVFSCYAKAMRQNIMDYILRSPEERKRLHIVMLPRSIPTATDRQLLRGGYSTIKFEGTHKRKIETQNEIKLRLLNNNIVTSALNHWWRDFRSFNLVDFKNLLQFVDSDMGTSGTACYSMDVDSFLAFQEAHRAKTLQLLRNIWHRGCILIIKKFKMFRLRQIGGNGDKGKWTFSGYIAKPDSAGEIGWQRSSIPDLKWEDIERFKMSSVLVRK